MHVLTWIRSRQRFEGRSDGDGLLLTVKLLLLLAVRKGELIAAGWEEFELEADPPVWHLPGIRTKTGQPLDIPLPTMAVEWLLKLEDLACNAE